MIKSAALWGLSTYGERTIAMDKPDDPLQIHATMKYTLAIQLGAVS